MAFAVEITGTNAPIREGDTLKVDATVENTGADPDSQTVVLTVGGSQRDSRKVRLENGQSTTITLSWATDAGDAGDYGAAVSSADDTGTVVVSVGAESDLSVAITGTNAPVTEGETIFVDATVENLKGETIAQTIVAGLSDPHEDLLVHFPAMGTGLSRDSTELRLADSAADTARVVLDPEESTDLSLAVGAKAYRKGTAPTYSRELWVGSWTTSRSTTVTVNKPPTPSVEITGTNAPVEEGEELTVTADVENVGGESGTLLVALTGYTDSATAQRQLQNDYDPNTAPASLESAAGPVETTGLTLAPGESKTVTLAWPTVPGDAGDRIASVTADPPWKEETDGPTFLQGPGTGGGGSDAQVVSITHGPIRTTRFSVEIDGSEVSGWSEIQLPSSSTEEGQYTDGSDPSFDETAWGRTEYNNVTMVRGAKKGDTRIRDWRDDVINGETEAGKRTMLITLEDDAGATVAQWEFTNAWPKYYDPPDLDATAVGGDSAMGQEELTIAYDRYKRTK